MSSQRLQKQKRVSWKGSVKCFLIDRTTTTTTTTTTTATPQTQTWYSEKEYEDFRKDIENIQRSILEDRLPSQTFCIRGIEHFIDPQLYSQRLSKRIQSWNTVLSVQKDSWVAEDRHEQSCDDTACAIASALIDSTTTSTTSSSSSSSQHPSLLMDDDNNDTDSEAYTRALQDQYEARIVYTAADAAAAAAATTSSSPKKQPTSKNTKRSSSDSSPPLQLEEDDILSGLTWIYNC